MWQNRPIASIRLDFMLKNLYRNYFDSHIRTRGQEYFNQGQVINPEVTEQFVNFEVKGSVIYKIKISLKEPKHAKCSCPLGKNGMFCKHMWAGVLMADTVMGTNETVNSLKWQDIVQKVSTSIKDTDEAAKQTNATAANYRPLRKAYFVIDSTHGLSLKIFYQEVKTPGKPSGLKAGNFSENSLDLYQDPNDQAILQFLMGDIRPVTPYSTSEFSAPTHLRLLGQRAEETIGFLIARRSLFQMRGVVRIDNLSVIKELGASLYPAIELAKTDTDVFHLKQVLVNDKGEIQTRLSKNSNTSFLINASNTLQLIQGSVGEFWQNFFKEANPFPIRVTEAKEFVLYYFMNFGTTGLNLFYPPEYKPEIENKTPTVQMHIKNSDLGWGFAATLRFFYDGIAASNKWTEISYIKSPQNTLIQRDEDTEAASWDQFFDLCKEDVHLLDDVSVNIPDAEIKDFITNAGEKFELYFQQQRLYSMKEFELKENFNMNWFDISGEAKFGENLSLSLPSLLLQMTRGKMVRLDTGEWGIIPDEIIDQLKAFSQIGKKTEDGIRLSKAQALLMEYGLQTEVAIKNAHLKNDKNTLVEILNKVQNPQALKAPEGFTGELRDYQQVGLGWLATLRENQLGGILADDMGLGKTIQVLAFLARINAEEKENPRIRKTAPIIDAETGEPIETINIPFLIVVPKSLLTNWTLEAYKFTPNLKSHVWTGSDRHLSIEQFKGSDLVITTYQLLVRDTEMFEKMRFNTIVFDEAHFVKNSATQSYKICSILNAENRVVLTGTPIENSIKDLISLLNLANPGLIDNRSGLVSSDPNQYKAVIRAAKPFILRRSKNDVLKDLPPKIEQIFYCEMTPAQMKSYQELKEFYRNSLVKNAPQQNGGQRKIQILEALLRLRQTALHPQLINEHYEDDSGKFDALIEMLENVYAEGHKALVFSQFTSALKILRKKIEALGMECCYLDGQTKDRAEVVKTFQTDESKKIFLMSLKAGGVGLNLTEASYVFILDPWWNPAAEAQAIDRAHRIGQTKTVTSYKLISKDSIEEKILALQKNKKLLADELFSQESSFVANLTEDDLDYLLS